MKEDVIPKGIYCYTTKYGFNGRGTPCPFWELREDKPHQENGYCHYMQIGDWMDKGPWLLWDQVKECGVNEDYEESNIGLI